TPERPGVCRNRRAEESTSTMQAAGRIGLDVTTPDASSLPLAALIQSKCPTTWRPASSPLGAMTSIMRRHLNKDHPGWCALALHCAVAMVPATQICHHWILDGPIGLRAESTV